MLRSNQERYNPNEKNQSTNCPRERSQIQRPHYPQGKAKFQPERGQHGLRAYSAFILGNESKADFDKLCDDLARIHQPVGDHENHLAWQIAGVIWRERRLWQTETALIDLEMDDQNLQLKVQANGKTDEPIRTAKAFKAPKLPYPPAHQSPGKPPNPLSRAQSQRSRPIVTPTRSRSGRTNPGTLIANSDNPANPSHPAKSTGTGTNRPKL